MNLRRHLSPFQIYLILIFAWFAFQCLFFALKIAPGIPPDENLRVAWIHLYQKGWFLIPPESPATYAFGSVSTVPYLYYLALGWLTKWVGPGFPELTTLRLINVGFALANLGFIAGILKLLTEDRIARALGLGIAANVLMLSFISGAVSYDNLVNLASSASLYFLLLFYRNWTRESLLAFLTACMVGLLTKATFVPLLGLLVGSALLYLGDFRKNWRKLVFERWSGRQVALVTATTILLGLNVQLYGSNLIKYHSLVPDPAVVLGPETAYRADPVSRRNHEFLLSAETRPEISFPRYVPQWFEMIGGRIFGIMAHRNMIKVDRELRLNTVALAPLLLLLIGYAGQLFRRKTSWILGVTLCLYSAFIFYVNYSDQIQYRFKGLGVQGRYLFPVLPAFLGLMVLPVAQLRNKRLAWALTFLITAAFVAGGFPYFLSHAEAEWFAP